jgi:hypothetical protein
LVKTFISYAREDKRFCDDLMKHLEVLIADGTVSVWNDAALVAGEDWERTIKNELHDTELFIFLWSIDAFNSDFVRNKEYSFARDRVVYGPAKIISILVRNFSQKSEFFNQLKTYQMLPESLVPIVESRGRDRIWASIVDEIARTCEQITGLHPVEDLANNAMSAQPDEGELCRDFGSSAVALPSVSQFWREVDVLAEQKRLVSIAGTFSEFAPFMTGPPIAKEALHKDFREQIDVQGLGNSESVDACLSLTAGQMVVRVDFASFNSKYVYFGLYNSIVRNSIPVFIERNYFQQMANGIFVDGQSSIEACVTGKISRIDNSFVFDYLDKYDLTREFKGSTLDYLRGSSFCLVVDGDNTRVDCLDPNPRYLDGDIWFGLQTGGKEIFVTTFLNIADDQVRREETTNLLERMYRKYRADYSVIASYESWREIDEVVRHIRLDVQG